MKLSTRLSKLPIIALGALLLVAPAFAADSQLATVHSNSSGLSFDALVSHGGSTLTISGPDGIAIRQAFGAGEDAVFSIFDNQGGQLPDGAYTYELLFSPRLDNSARAALADARAHGETVHIQGMEPVYGFFTIRNGAILSDTREEAGGLTSTSAAAASGELTNEVALAQTFATDLIVQGSACIGIDCSSSESFGFDTLRLKENNLRIKFDDTSASASFPNNDWQLAANDSSNGGANKFSLDDITNGKTPFTVGANAPSNSLFVEADSGDIGVGTATPVVEVHIADGDSPTLRLEQNGSSGFTPQTWDLAGNETNFFVRDVTNGSKLPFKILPNAPDDSIVIEGTTGDIGFGTKTPDAELDIQSSSQPEIHITNTSHTGAASSTWRLFYEDTGNFAISFDQSGGREFEIDPSGNATILGTLTVTGGITPDYVFEADYELRTIAELEAFITENKHLPNVPSAEQVAKNGLNVTEMQNALLEKVEELTLYTIEQQKALESQSQAIEELRALNAQLMSKVSQAES